MYYDNTKIIINHNTGCAFSHMHVEVRGLLCKAESLFYHESRGLNSGQHAHIPSAFTSDPSCWLLCNLHKLCNSHGLLINDDTVNNLMLCTFSVFYTLMECLRFQFLWMKIQIYPYINCFICSLIRSMESWNHIVLCTEYHCPCSPHQPELSPQ